LSARTRVAILGGGAGSMTAAFYLSHTPELRDRFEVTVYQMGWRLGGKGANGRRADAGQRIEEHGLHVWGGFYANAFRTVRECYEQLGRPAGSPLATAADAFIPGPHVVWEELLNGQWKHWPVEVPTTPGLPGTGGELPTEHQYIELLVAWIHDQLTSWPHASIKQALAGREHAFASLIHAALADVEDGIQDLFDGSALSAFHTALASARKAAETGDRRHYDPVLACLDATWNWLRSSLMNDIVSHDESRRLFIVVDLAIAMARGMIRDRIFEKGFTAIDDLDFTEWLAGHGADQLGLQSAPLRGFYDYFFAYADGDAAKPRMSAAMGLYHLLRLCFTFKCSLFFKMTSGMGDAVFGPLFETCKQNGVTFRFFHEVLEVVPDPTSMSIASVRINRQVETKDEYRPLVTVNGLPSWPSEPLRDQLTDESAARLRRSGCDLEDPWSGWDGGTEITLQSGRDFDVVILGIPVGAHGMICPQLVERSPEWRAMVGSLQTIQTQAMQLWWTKPLISLGATSTLATGTGYGQPMESWSDMSHVLPRESWPPGVTPPQSVVYFCGPMKNPDRTPVGPDPAFGAGQKAAARAIAMDWCLDFLPHLYPGTMSGEAIDWSLLAVADGSVGPARFDAQYHRANYTPSERYVLDLPGTSQYRLDAGASGFSNLLLAGDWVFTGLGGAVESAVIGGMQAAEAATGQSLGIIGALANPWSRLPRYQR
jgi:uncharacterized protein with NAD-binding domain and iron-sulfur cluster